MTLRDFFEFIEKEDKRLICFGTGLMAEDALVYKEIKSRIDFFCDNDKEKQGRIVNIGTN